MKRENITANKLLELFDSVENDDSYLVSPVYYLMSGRNGGEIIRHGMSHIIAIQHPNKKNSVLLFPKVSPINIGNDLSEEIEVASFIKQNNPYIETRIGRIPEALSIKHKDKMVVEELLDWKYPVQILGTKDMVELKGGRFQQIRQRINNLSCCFCESSPIKSYKDFDDIKKLSIDWTKGFRYSMYSSLDLISPILKLLELMTNPKLNLHGQIIKYKELPTAFCIWETRGTIANAFAMVATRSIKGLAEYNIVEMCRRLNDFGISKVNLGGSESEGLNRFKKKFSPVKSIELKTCIV